MECLYKTSTINTYEEYKRFSWVLYKKAYALFVVLFGFPFDFYMIKFAVDGKFAIHYNIAGFVADIVVIYFVLTLIDKVWKNRGEVE